MHSTPGLPSTLLHLPDGHSPLHVQDAMVEAMSRLPETVRRTLTWDQCREMANHAQISAATDLGFYFAIRTRCGSARHR